MLQCKNFFKLEIWQFFSNSVILKNFDIICLSEIWLTNEIRESEIFPQNYNCFLSNSRSSLQSTSHGGTLICVKSGLISEPAHFSFITNGAAEACYIRLDKRKLLAVSGHLPRAISKYALKPKEIINLFKDINKIAEELWFVCLWWLQLPLNMSSIKETEISFLGRIIDFWISSNW